MATRIGFYIFAGLVVGAVVGKWLPYIASIEALAGGVLGGLLGLLVDKLSANKQGG